MALPMLCATYGSLASLSRYMRTGLLDVIRSDLEVQNPVEVRIRPETKTSAPAPPVSLSRPGPPAVAHQPVVAVAAM